MRIREEVGMNRIYVVLLAATLVIGSAGVVGVGAAVAGTLFTADLSGSNEVPPTGSTATGHANLYLSADETNLHVKLTVTGFTNLITASHIHVAEPTVNGPVVFGIGAFTSTIEADWALSAANVADLKAGLYYVNVHSDVFPGGEIRGQVVGSLSYSFLANLAGSNEVPPTGSTKTGVGDVTLHADGSNLHIDLTASGFASGAITASHIHQAPPGVNGGIVFAISGAFTNRIAKDFAPTPSQVSDLTAGAYYVNIHSVAFPGGEIRGQLIGSPAADVTPVSAGNGFELRAGPNPMRDATTLRYALPSGYAGRLEIFDVAGRTVNRFEAPATAESIVWDGRDRNGSTVPHGVYFARLVSGRDVETVSLAVVR
jgi:hypothetical protein